MGSIFYPSATEYAHVSFADMAHCKWDTFQTPCTLMSLHHYYTKPGRSPSRVKTVKNNIIFHFCLRKFPTRNRNFKRKVMIFSPISMESNYRRCFFSASAAPPPPCYYTRTVPFSSTAGATDSSPPDFPGHKTAYDILGIPETSSFDEIKASFRNLAKQTHPDLSHSSSSASSSHRFVQILAAYEILSDSERRAHYDNYLLSQRKLLIRKQSRQGSTLYRYQSQMHSSGQMEVVEWLRWYRLAVNEIVSEKRVVAGTGYFDVLEADFYSAIHAAFYGPEIESMDLLPDRFEAEERSVYDTPEVLHLVSGRDLFGMVRLVNKFPELQSSAFPRKLSSLSSDDMSIGRYAGFSSMFMNANGIKDGWNSPKHAGNIGIHASDAYRDLELHVFGKVVAVATRTPPKGQHDGLQNENAEDQINVFLSSDDDPIHFRGGISKKSFLDGLIGSRIPLGTITGLGTSPEEGSCSAYDTKGRKTHVIMKHRTLMVKHVHWYGVGDDVSVCECRCSRARLPPSRFWLFEPRCGMHDIGGWYVETFGRDKKGRTVPSQRYWDGFDGGEHYDKRLHPAMYLLGLAYRTLDLEEAKRRKGTVRDIIEGQLLRVLHWCKKLV